MGFAAGVVHGIDVVSISVIHGIRCLPALLAGASKSGVNLGSAETARLVALCPCSVIGERVLCSDFLEIEEPDDSAEHDHQRSQETEQGRPRAGDGVELRVRVSLTGGQRDDQLGEHAYRYHQVSENKQTDQPAPAPQLMHAAESTVYSEPHGSACASRGPSARQSCR